MNNDYSQLLTGASQLGPYPMEKLKKVDTPTTRITDSIERFDEREMAFARARRERSGAPPVAGSTIHGAPTSLSMTLMSALGMAANLSDTEPASEKVNLPDDPHILSRHIKSAAYFVGADVVGICELPQWAVYSHDMRGEPIECNHKYAICIVVDQGLETMEAADGNDWISASQSGRGYAMCGYIGGIIASYIRSLGYPAKLHSIRGYEVIVPPLLLLSGIGELSRANIVLNPFLGLRYKASVVTTDLPVDPDKPVDFGLQDFCEKCMKCADLCPSRSIDKGEKKMINGYERWEFNSETCMKYRFSNPKGVSCGKCIKVCPWNKVESWTHGLVRWMIDHTPLMNGFFVKMDDLLGYEKPHYDKKWWLNP
jgi:reductive dehalogenase